MTQERERQGDQGNQPGQIAPNQDMPGQGNMPGVDPNQPEGVELANPTGPRVGNPQTGPEQQELANQ